MTPRPFASQARNAEDVVIWRALGQVQAGHGIEVVGDGVQFTSLGALREHGWSITEVPASSVAEVEAPVHAVPGQDLHVLAGSDETVTIAALGGLLAGGRTPWVVVVASGERAGASGHDPHNAIVGSGYTHTLFDGVNNFFLHESHAELAERLSYPACAQDDYTTPGERALAVERDALVADLAAATTAVMRWRAAALSRWESASLSTTNSDIAHELAVMRNTVSWRITKPLRTVRSRIPNRPAKSG